MSDTFYGSSAHCNRVTARSKTGGVERKKMAERYQVRGRVGRGGMSAVYRAFDTVMGREVALKRLLPVEETNLNEAAGDSLAREAAALARFQHPNVITVYAFEEDEEGPFVVMELIEGEDLHSIMKTGALSWDDFRSVAAQCLEPLVLAGELNLLHRDIKPGNIMLTVTPSGRFLVKLLDFGLAKFSQQPSLQTLDQKGSFLGSIDFIAPEQLELCHLDQRTDLYSLGCVFYYMLAQESPFSGGSPAETSMNHIKHRCRPIGEIRTDLPPLVADWLMRMISRYPDDRPSSAKEALEQFRDANDGIPFVSKEFLQEETSEEIPFARFVSGPPASGPIEQAAIALPARVTEAKSSPNGPSISVGAGSRRRIQSGPVRGSGTKPNLAFSPNRPNPMPRTPPRYSEKRNIPPTLFQKRFLIAGAGGLFLVALLLLIFGSQTKEEAPVIPPIEESAVEITYEPLTIPATLPRSDGKTDPPAPPLKSDLYAWFSSAKGLYGRNYRTRPEPGEQIAAWVNLASVAVESSLLRDNGDVTGAYLPRLNQYPTASNPGLRADAAGVSTTNRTSLSMGKSENVLPAGFTVAAVMRMEATDDRFLRIQSPVWDGRSVSFGGSYGEKMGVFGKWTSEGPDARLALPWRHGQVGIFVYVLNPDAKTQTLAVRLAGERESNIVSGDAPVEGAAFGIVAVGKRGFGDGFDDITGNAIFEILIYPKIFSDEEVESVTEYLSARYLVPVK